VNATIGGCATLGIRPILSLYREILKRKRGPTTWKGDGLAMLPMTLCKRVEAFSPGVN
jgi:hypothetical protein